MAIKKAARARKEEPRPVKGVPKEENHKKCKNLSRLQREKGALNAPLSSTARSSPPTLLPTDVVQGAPAMWADSTITPDWTPQRSRKDTDSTDTDCPCDRFDIAGTTHVNELVLRHGTMATSDLKVSPRPTLFKRVSARHQAASAKHDVAGGASSDPHFLLERYLSNLVRALVHPLHNFLQCHHGLHNADEVQVMLMPRDGPIAAADRTADASRAPSTSPGTAAGSRSAAFRRCYVATNNETLTEESLQRAVQGWGVAGVFQISDFVLVRGEKGRHAEQKLLDHLRSSIVAANRLAGSATALTADQKALVVGERLPCVACRLFGVLYEDIAVLLPSHGHMYLTTISPSIAALWSSKAVSEKGKRAICDAYASPAAAAKLLLASGHQRVLR